MLMVWIWNLGSRKALPLFHDIGGLDTWGSSRWGTKSAKEFFVHMSGVGPGSV